jgi:hypothetical protein
MTLILHLLSSFRQHPKSQWESVSLFEVELIGTAAVIYIADKDQKILLHYFFAPKPHSSYILGMPNVLHSYSIAK